MVNFEQHQENDSEPIFSGSTILSWTIVWVNIYSCRVTL